MVIVDDSYQQGRVEELEEWQQIVAGTQDRQDLIYRLSDHLTQRTAERDTARRRVDELEAREVDVVLLRDDLEQRTAELEAANDTAMYAGERLGIVLVERDELQAELERVRGELVEAKDFLNTVTNDLNETAKERDDLRTLIAALPKVEGEISERFCTGSYYSSPYDYRSHVTFETALVALLKHRQGMEG